MTLTEFLLARIAEDEANARSEDLRDQWHRTNCGYWMWEDDAVCECGYPARVLAECEAKRRIVERFTGNLHEKWDDGHEAEKVAEVVLRDLATIYADHPDFHEEWRV